MSSRSAPRARPIRPILAAIGTSAVIHAGLFVALAFVYVGLGQPAGAEAAPPFRLQLRPTAAAEETASVVTPPPVDRTRVPAAQAPMIDVLAVPQVLTPDEERPTAKTLDRDPSPPRAAFAGPIVRVTGRRGAGGSTGVGAGGGGSAIGVGGGGGTGSGPSAFGAMAAASTDGSGELAGIEGEGGGASREPAIDGALAAPVYPERARAKGWQGRVVLLVSVDEKGHVAAVEVATSSGRTALDEAACEAARDWRFRPALRDGRPVAGSLRVPVRFELTN